MEFLSCPKYFPIDKGIYEVAMGLRPLGFDFGNGDFDKKVFQLTKNYPEFLINKNECLKEDMTKYLAEFNLNITKINKLIDILIQLMTSEYPEVFKLEKGILKSTLNQISIDIYQTNRIEILNQLVLMVEEDIVLVSREQGNNYLSYLNVCGPSHWSPNEKIGKSFFDIHVDIPHIEKLNSNADKIIDLMVTKGPFVRFIWSFVTDLRINHHPIPPKNYDPLEWKGRSFNTEAKIPFNLRIERQVIYPIPEIDSSLFTIGVSFISGEDIKNNPHYNHQLKSALMSMSKESRIYKGVDHCFNELVNYLS